MDLDTILIRKKKNSYSTTEGGYRYEIPPELYNGFQLFMLKFDAVNKWYKQLTSAEREKVQRVSEGSAIV